MAEAAGFEPAHRPIRTVEGLATLCDANYAMLPKFKREWFR